MAAPKSPPAANAADRRGDTRWFVRDRFGLFIHWGLYSLGARHEWLQNRERIPAAEYERRYLPRFDPDLYNPGQWAAAAADAGMKYMVATTKHHEGFCLWDSQLTGYKATNTPAGRDLIAPMAQAFRDAGLRIGFYHSLLDWHHPHFVQDSVHGPHRDDPDREKHNVGRDQARYAAYLHGQVRELLTRYGKIDILWFDFSYPKPDGSGKGRADWKSEELLALVRELQPDIILDDRLDLDRGWDVKTPEQATPRAPVTVDGRRVVWEACQTLSGSWGYHRDEATWRSADELARTLVQCVANDGNLLLNVGPTGRGEFDDRTLSRLTDIGRWMRRHGRAVYGCGPAPAEFETPPDARLTYNPATKRLYVHLFAWPYKFVHLDGAFRERVEYAQFLHDASELPLGIDEWHANQIGDTQRTLTLQIPSQRPDQLVPVIELFLKDA